MEASVKWVDADESGRTIEVVRRERPARVSISPFPMLPALARLYPPERLLAQPGQLVSYESDGLTAYRARPRAVVIPETQAEVIETVRLCHQQRVPFVARGSGTSL